MTPFFKSPRRGLYKSTSDYECSWTTRKSDSHARKRFMELSRIVVFGFRQNNEIKPITGKILHIILNFSTDKIILIFGMKI